ncbi:VanW family protein|uniref:Vancomycin resistance protein YoaR, contains peptidoglycan-binding and VanW domains n=1 Tax=Dendrosporobacter quercicolus TaxID=146817 RepID=A0A1G9V404_9FIRM|nr:VanW family protein [Dendrosporobacter quercicolus]NSL47930.1 VanW family protein [Dendrosporobacter quercicolus DSM 1736]SDM66922.1 Vancomycin resistance protein YoaR, contains peptidoglycan-binding and VanW domains [Dendrosporobacter quercicolus]
MRGKILLCLAGLLMIAVSLAGWNLVKPLYGSSVYAGIAVEGVEVGGRSRAEVAQLIQVWRQEQLAKAIDIYYGDTVFKIDAQSIDFDFDIEATVDEAWNYGRRGSLWEKLKNIYIAGHQGYRIPVKVKYNESKLEQLVEVWRESIERPPRNAALSLLTGGVVPQEQGRKLEVEVLRPLVVQALKKPDVSGVALPVTPLYPAITVSDIQRTGIREMLSNYSTRFNSQDVNRSTNIKLAANKINGHIVYPGQAFSFNEVVGPREKNYGFKEAMELVDGELVPGIGGGICQVSSTLYNAVLLADLAITERYNHSKPLGYVPLGRDATVVFGVLDFKFTNTAKSPVMIIAEVNGDQLVVGLFGRERPAAAVEVISLEQRIIPPEVVKKQDATMYLGETKVDKQGKPGYEITTVRVVRSAGRELKREILSKDQYLPDHTIVKFGTQIPSFVAEH